MSDLNIFGDAMLDYGLAVMAGGFILGLGAILVGFLGAFSVLMTLSRVLALVGGVAGAVVYLVLNLRSGTHGGQDQGLEIAAAVSPFIVTPPGAIILGSLLKFLG